MTTEFIDSGPRDAPAVLLLAHGAGAPMTSRFLETFASLLAARGLATARFEFDYMAARRSGRRRPPPRAERLGPEYVAAVAAVRGRLRPGQSLLIGGKSMGGRVASLVAGELHAAGRIAGLVCLGYPFHPPGRPEALRTAHLAGIMVPTLVVQGEGDPFGTRAEIEPLPLSPAIRFHWVTDGDHDLAPRRAAGSRPAQGLEEAAAAVAAFMRAAAPSGPFPPPPPR